MIGWKKIEVRENKKNRDNQSAVIFCGVNGIEIKQVNNNELSPADKFIIKESKQLTEFDEKRLYKKYGY